MTQRLARATASAGNSCQRGTADELDDGAGGAHLFGHTILRWAFYCAFTELPEARVTAVVAMGNRRRRIGVSFALGVALVLKLRGRRSRI